VHLVNVIKTNIEIQDLVDQETLALGRSDIISEAVRQEYLKKKIEFWNKLQSFVELLIDSSSAPARNGTIPTPGVRQLLEKKEGIFRMNMYNWI
jgi:DNA-directed RNA polymerase beta' subunit